MILFIDDDTNRVENDVFELVSWGFSVQLEGSVDSALQFFDQHFADVDAVICDIVMPHGLAVSAEDSIDGLRTGVAVFRHVRQRCPTLPFIFFTNLSHVEDMLRKECLDEERTWLYLEKRNFLSLMFAERVRDFLESQQKRRV
jgi:CheY-like chemotaxis protein